MVGIPVRLMVLLSPILISTTVMIASLSRPVSEMRTLQVAKFDPGSSANSIIIDRYKQHPPRKSLLQWFSWYLCGMINSDLVIGLIHSILKTDHYVSRVHSATSLRCPTMSVTCMSKMSPATTAKMVLVSKR